MTAALEPGLLEQTRLLIVGGADVRPLQGAAGGEAGRACWRPGPAWRRWLFPLLLVREVPELPLVFTVERRWGLHVRWRVRDADGEAVGTLAGHWLLDRWDRPAVYLRRGEDGGNFLAAASGQHLGAWRRAAEGTWLTFPTDDDPDPFTRMLLVAAVLCAG